MMAYPKVLRMVANLEGMLVGKMGKTLELRLVAQ